MNTIFNNWNKNDFKHWLENGYDLWVEETDMWKAFLEAQLNIFDSLTPQLVSFYNKLNISNKKKFDAAFIELFLKTPVRENKFKQLLLMAELLAQLQYYDAIPAMNEKILYLYDLSKTSEAALELLAHFLDVMSALSPHKKAVEALEQYFYDPRTPQELIPMLYIALCKYDSHQWIKYFEIFGRVFADEENREKYLSPFFAVTFVETIRLPNICNLLYKIDAKEYEWFYKMLSSNVSPIQLGIYWLPQNSKLERKIVAYFKEDLHNNNKYYQIKIPKNNISQIIRIFEVISHIERKNETVNPDLEIAKIQKIIKDAA